MPDDLNHLLANNRAWAERIQREDADFFNRLSAQQRPQYLWIGCSDSRVPANQVIGLMPGEVFVHRNVANVILDTDVNCLAVVEFAVKVLKVRHIIVCGHHGCGGVEAAMRDDLSGFAGSWLSSISDLKEARAEELADLDPEAALARMCEWNVLHQLRNLAHTRLVREAWKQGQPLALHGWIYSLRDGLIRDLSVTVASPTDLPSLDSY